MSSIEVGIIGFSLIMLFTLAGVHVAFALILVGFSGLAVLIGATQAASSITLIAFDKINSYEFAVVPLFLLMSAFVSRSGIANGAYKTACAWIGHFKGGLAMATTVACGLFAACCGSSLAAAIAMGKMAYPEMKRYRYDATLSAGVIAAGGTLGILIPPSIGFILVGIMTQLSIGKLFIAGIVPGILEVFFYLATIYIMCRINPSLGPALPAATFHQKIDALNTSWPVVLLFLLVIGGIYGGVFTPTEAGGIGAFGALTVGLIRKQFDLTNFTQCLLEASKMTAMIIALIIGAFVFNQFLAITRIPFITCEYIVGLGLSKYFILLLILFIYLVLGMVFDIFAILVLTIPIVYPTMVGLGFDPIWYAVIMVRVIEIGLITPPFGINIFGMAGAINLPVTQIYKGVLPFLAADMLHVALLITVPSLSTFLPTLMMGN